MGLREKVDHAAEINRQRQPEKDDAERRRAVARIYLPGIALTVPRPVGRKLLENTDIRTRIGCRVDACGRSVNGPALDPRAHYLHARAANMARLLAQPEAWRHSGEVNRLRRALEVRQLINRSHLGADDKPLPTRTLESLIDDIEAERANLTA